MDIVGIILMNSFSCHCQNLRWPSLLLIIDWRVVLGGSKIIPDQRQSLLTLSRLLLLGRCTWQRRIWSRPFSPPRRQYSRTTARKGKCTKPEKVSNFKLFVYCKTQHSPKYDECQIQSAKVLAQLWKLTHQDDLNDTLQYICEFQVGFPLLRILRLVLVYPNPW